MIGTSLTHYRLTAKLGEGGMGEVYRATDTKLGREVAIKVLPAGISRDAQSLARFEREAKALATLNHPNVAAIHGFDADRERHFIVLELVEGETLAERLRCGPLPIEEALRVAQQIAEAVEAAHAKGIVHRDLKPGNIKFTADGRVKVLDFGLAKLTVGTTCRSSPESRDAQQRVPTTAAVDAATIVEHGIDSTTPGVVMGTPAYMSPEQARGQEVDKRTDVWAFGCCLFECLSGNKPFAGETVTDMMAAVLRSEPDWSALPAETPREVLTLLRRCMEKEPRRRLSSLGDIAILLEDTTPSRAITPVPAPRSERAAEAKSFGARYGLALGVAGVVIGLVIAGIGMWRQPKSVARASQIRSLAVLPFEVNTPDPKLAGLDKWIPVEIISKLGQVTNLQVVNLPAKIEQLVSQKKSEDEIARELRVDGLVRGQLHGQGEAMTVYVSVVDGATGHTVGETRKLAASVSRMSEIPNQVALAVVEELKLQISATQRSGLQEPETKNSEAFLAYQKGRDLLSSRKFSEAVVELRRAYQLDPNYTRAWTILALAEWIPLIYGGTTNELQTVFKRLSGEAEKFHVQRPDDPVVSSLQMWIALVFERNWNKVRTIYWENQRDRNPDSDLSHAMMWYYTFIEGHPEQAAKAGEQAIALAPENLIYQIDHAYHLFHFGRYEQALRELRKLPPEKIQLEDYSRVLIAVGDLAGARELATRVQRLRPNAMTQARLAEISAKLGATAEARTLLRELEAQAEQGMHIPYAHIAAAYGALGDFENTRRWLRKGLVEGHGSWSMLELRTAYRLDMFGKFSWYWEIIDEMKFPPLQADSPFFALEQQMRYGRGRIDTTTSTNEPPKTLAVLPFVNMSADKDNEYLSDGITEEILNALAKVPGLRVPARTSSFVFKDKKEDIRKIGELLNVSTVLEGSVRKAGNQLRITAQLINVADGFHLWSETYDRNMTNIFSIQDDIARTIVARLRLTLAGAAGLPSAKHHTANVEAYEFYLKGKFHRDKLTEPELRQAITYFQAALTRQPDYALAYAGLAGAYGTLRYFAYVPPGSVTPQFRDAVAKALELDDTLAQAHSNLGSLRFWVDWDWVAAERAYQRALELDPALIAAHESYAYLLAATGRHAEALAEATKAQQLDPLSVNANVAVGWVSLFAQDYDRALEAGRQAIAMAPDFFPAHQLTGAALFRGDQREEGIAEMEKAAQLAPVPEVLGGLGLMYGRAGRRADAQKLLDQLLARAEQRYVPASTIAQVYDGLGDFEQANVWVTKAITNREGNVVFFKAADELTRANPHYPEWLKKIGLEK